MENKKAIAVMVTCDEKGNYHSSCENEDVFAAVEKVEVGVFKLAIIPLIKADYPETSTENLSE